MGLEGEERKGINRRKGLKSHRGGAASVLLGSRILRVKCLQFESPYRNCIRTGEEKKEGKGVFRNVSRYYNLCFL